MSFKRWKAQSFPDKLFDILNYTILTIAAIVCLYPLYYIVIVSFSREVYGAWLLPNGFSLEGYQLVFKNGEIWTAYRNTIFYTLGGVAMGLFLTIPYAYAISRKDLPGGFLEAKASARPRMMQLTTIRGRYTPSAVSRLGRNALTIICTTETKPAMTVM